MYATHVLCRASRNTSRFLIHPPLPTCCQRILSPRSCSYTTICMVSHSSLPPVPLVVPLVVCQILCFMHLFAMLSREAPRVCPEALVSSISSVHLHWVQLQGLDCCLYVTAFLVSGMPVSEVMTYFMYFKMLVCMRMDLKFKVEFYL